MRPQTNTNLSSEDEDILLRLADPAAPAAQPTNLSRERFEAIAAHADLHGVLPIVLRKFSEIGAGDRQQVAPYDAQLRQLRDQSVITIGQSMLLQHRGERAVHALSMAGIPARIVKGPIFSRALYSHHSDRPFTDIDIVVEPENLERASSIMEQLDFVLEGDADTSRQLQEFKWVARDNRKLLIEIQGNLVHGAGMRRRLSLGFTELAKLDGERLNSPATLLTTAIVHASGGHKFNSLRLCVDVLQGVRQLQSADDEKDAMDAARMIGAEMEFAVVLNVVGKTFHDERAIRMADQLTTSAGARLGRRLITRNTVVGVNSRRRSSRIRRDLFRWIQRLA